ncbi:MAG: hypothetical protein CL694_13660 [Chloroflexi bacterium]|nr:hypothetical protein [Chloroflexota bacterium]
MTTNEGIVRFDADVLVIGGGGAGAMAAVKAAGEGADTLVVTKGPYPSGNSSIALAGYAVALGSSDPRDNPQVHFEDIIRNGVGLNNQSLVKIWVNEIVGLTREMEEWGIDLIREDGKLAQRPWPGHTYPRMVHHHMTTGKAVTKSLGQKSEEVGVRSLPHTVVGGLLKSGAGVVGAWGVQYQTGQPVLIRSKSVILTTGGMGHLFPATDNVGGVTGEGYALALRAGAEFIDMEFCHFVPGPCHPPRMRIRDGFQRHVGALINEGGAKLFNGAGERFMKRQFPDSAEKGLDGESLVKAIGFELCEGRAGPHGGVFLDLSDVPQHMRESTFSEVWATAERAGIDVSYQPVEITPTLHDLVGGVKIDESGGAGVPGLYAAGEAAGGVHGASRFGGSALSDALAFGAISGRAAAQYSRQVDAPTSGDDAEAELQAAMTRMLSPREGQAPGEIRSAIQSTAYQYLNAVRSGDGLTRALTELDRIGDRLPEMFAWAENPRQRGALLRQAIEVDGQVELARILATAALYREESRGGLFGGHYRNDFPDQDDENWLKSVIVSGDGPELSCHTQPPVKI